MSYLYGDSTPSALEVNYIEFLRDGVEFCVQVLLADQRIVDGRTQIRALEQATAAEIVRLQKAGALVPKAFEGAATGEPGSATARCVTAIVRAAADLVRGTATDIRSTLDAEVNKRDADAAAEREACVEALERLLVKHDLPGMKSELSLVLVGGARYVCRANVTTGFGLGAIVDLDVPVGHLFERVVRVDRLADRLEVLAPELGGWLHKEVKLRPQHLERHHVVELSIGAVRATLKLRATPDGSGGGFDVMFAGDTDPVRLVRVDEQGKSEDPPFEVEEVDVPKLLAVREKLAVAATELAAHRKTVSDAKIDGEPLASVSKPALIAERLIATMAPVVQEIATRSHSPGELVLRRLLGGDRREEIFLSKQELKQKLEPLNDANRALFDPLWAEGVAATSSPTIHSAVTRPAIGLAADHPSISPAPSYPPVSATPTPPPISLLGSHGPTSPAPSPAASTFPPPAPDPRNDSPLLRSVEAALAPAASKEATSGTAAARSPALEPPKPTPPRSPTPMFGSSPLGASTPASASNGPGASTPAAAATTAPSVPVVPSGTSAPANPVAAPPTAVVLPPPPPPPRPEFPRPAAGTIESPKTTPASMLDRPPPPPVSTGEVEINLDDKPSRPGSTNGKH
jgi:hypothetical protein